MDKKYFFPRVYSHNLDCDVMVGSLSGAESLGQCAQVLYESAIKLGKLKKPVESPKNLTDKI